MCNFCQFSSNEEEEESDELDEDKSIVGEEKDVKIRGGEGYGEVVKMVGEIDRRR